MSFSDYVSTKNQSTTYDVPFWIQNGGKVFRVDWICSLAWCTGTTAVDREGGVGSWDFVLTKRPKSLYTSTDPERGPHASAFSNRLSLQLAHFGIDMYGQAPV